MIDPALLARMEGCLEQVVEPCSIAFGKPVSIVEMGLVEGVTLDDGHATITLCLTDAACVHFAGMQHFIADELLALAEVSSVEVRQTLDQLWTPDRRRAS